MPIISPKNAKGRPIVPSTTCAWNDHGETCKYAGIMSYSTNGSGPWYCREHWCELNDYSDMKDERKRGNELPTTPLHSYAVDEIRVKLKREV